MNLNEIWNWVHMSPNQICIHSGDELNETVTPSTPYARDFVSSDMYKRNTTLFPLENYELKLEADIVIGNTSYCVDNLHKDFDQLNTLSTYLDQTTKQYFDNSLVINDQGVFTSSLTRMFDASSWNTFIEGYRTIYYTDINDGYNNHQSSLDPTTTWHAEDTTTTDPGDPDPQPKAWYDQPGYNKVIYNESTLIGRYVFLYNKRRAATTPESTMLDERLAYLDHFVKNDTGVSAGDATADITANDVHVLFEYLILNSNTTLSGTLNVTLWPFIKVPTVTADPNDGNPYGHLTTEDRYTWTFEYKTNTWDEIASNILEVRFYDNGSGVTNGWSESTNSNITTVYNTSGYYTQLYNGGSSYLDDQKYVDVREVSNNNDVKYTFGEGLDKVTIRKTDLLGSLMGYEHPNTTTNAYVILLNGQIATWSQVQDFIDDYIGTDVSAIIDSRVTRIKIRFGQNLIYGYDKTFPTSHDMFEFYLTSVKSLGGKKGDITFNSGTLSSNEVEFRIGDDNVLHGYAPADADINPVGVIFMWPAITGLNAPSNYFICDGSNVSQADYSALYGVIGDTYNDSTTQAGYFRIPDMRGLITGMNFIIKH